jgi:hypothetical protein
LRHIAIVGARRLTDRDTVDRLVAFRRIPSSYPAVPLVRVHGQRGPQASVGYLESTLLTNASLEYTRLLQSAAGILLMAGLTVAGGRCFCWGTKFKLRRRDLELDRCLFNRRAEGTPRSSLSSARPSLSFSEYGGVDMRRPSLVAAVPLLLLPFATGVAQAQTGELALRARPRINATPNAEKACAAFTINGRSTQLFLDGP